MYATFNALSGLGDFWRNYYYFVTIHKLLVLKRLLLALGMLGSCFSYAQKHHEIGLWVGTANYYGDLQTKRIPWGNDFSRTYQPAAGITYKYFVNPRVGFRFGGSYMRLTAADSLSNVNANYLRNLHFANDIYELHGGIEINLLPVDMEKFMASPYIFAGIGGFYSSPFVLNTQSEKINLRNLGTEGQGLPQYPDRQVYPVLNASFPVGLGVKLFVGNTIMLSLEAAVRYTSTDYLDDVSKSYVNLDTLLHYRGEVAYEWAHRAHKRPEWDKNYPDYKFQRGDYKTNDWFWTVGFTATVYFDAFGNPRKYIQGRCPRIFGLR